MNAPPLVTLPSLSAVIRHSGSVGNEANLGGCALRAKQISVNCKGLPYIYIS
jgi:hypothetical protein